MDPVGFGCSVVVGPAVVLALVPGWGGVEPVGLGWRVGPVVRCTVVPVGYGRSVVVGTAVVPGCDGVDPVGFGCSVVVGPAVVAGLVPGLLPMVPSRFVGAASVVVVGASGSMLVGVPGIMRDSCGDAGSV